MHLRLSALYTLKLLDENEAWSVMQWPTTPSWNSESYHHSWLACLRTLTFTGLQVYTPSWVFRCIQWNKLWYPSRKALFGSVYDRTFILTELDMLGRARPQYFGGSNLWRLKKLQTLSSSVWTSWENHDQLSKACLAARQGRKHDFEILYPWNFVSIRHTCRSANDFWTW